MLVTVNADVLKALYAHNILLNYNAQGRTDSKYGWLSVGQQLKFREQGPLIENSVGLYGGAYTPLPGGAKYAGFASLGAFSYSYSALPELLQVGRYCSLSGGIRFLDSTHPMESFTTSAAVFRTHNLLFRDAETKEVRDFAASFQPIRRDFPVIENDVWIGANVTLSMGIRVGTGAVIAYGSVVTRDVPPYAVVAGVPASIRRYRFSDELIARLLASRWWELDPAFVFATEVGSPERLCDRIEKSAGSVAPLARKLFSFAGFSEQ